MPNDQAEAYTYKKTRRYDVPKGTRAASVCLTLDPRRRTPEANSYVRIELQERAIRMCIEAWINEFGAPAFRWDCVQILVTHVTIQVVVEIRMID